MQPAKDKEAVSPVVGTILLVAITVVLAGVLIAMLSGFSDLGSWSSKESDFPDPGAGPVIPPLYHSPGLTDTKQEVNNADLSLSEGTVMTWVRMDDVNPWTGLIIKGVALSTSDYDQSYGLQMAGPALDSNAVGQLGWCQSAHNDLGGSTGEYPLFFIVMDGVDGNDVNYGVRSPVKMELGQWYFISGSFSANRIEIHIYSESAYLGSSYVTVKDVHSSTSSEPAAEEARTTLTDNGNKFVPRQTDQPLLILTQGMDQSWSDFDGAVFDWRIYSSALSKSSADSVWMSTRSDLP